MDSYFKIKILSSPDNNYLDVQEKHDDEKIIITCGNTVLIQKPSNFPELQDTWSLPASDSYTCPAVYCPRSQHIVAVRNNTILELRSQTGELVRSVKLSKPVYSLLPPTETDQQPLVVWAHGAVQSLSAVLESHQQVPKGCLAEDALPTALARCHNTVYLVAATNQDRTTLHLHYLEADQPSSNTTPERLEPPRSDAQLLTACHVPSYGVLFLWSTSDLTTPTRHLTLLGGSPLTMAALGPQRLALLTRHNEELRVEVWNTQACLQTHLLELHNQDGHRLSYVKGHLLVSGRKGIHRIALSTTQEVPCLSALVGSRKKRPHSQSPNRHKRKRKSNHHSEDKEHLLKLAPEALRQMSEEQASQLILECIHKDDILFPLPPRNGVPFHPERAKPLFFKKLLTNVNLDPEIMCQKASPQDLKVLVECVGECLRIAKRSDYQLVLNLTTWARSALRRSFKQFSTEQLTSYLLAVDTLLGDEFSEHQKKPCTTTLN